MAGIGLDGIGASRLLGGAGASAQGAAGAAAAGGATGSGNAFEQLLGDLTQAQTNADRSLANIATGGPQDLHDAVLSVQMESLAFDLAVQIRNRLVDAYQEIFRMTV